MRQLLVTVILLLSASSIASAQYWVGSFGVNYGTYSMKRLKDLQSASIKESKDVPLAAVESFPATIGFETRFLRSFNKFSIGMFASRASTGARASYADYSGVYNKDIIATNFVVGLALEGAFVKREAWELFFTFQTGFSSNDVKVKSTLNIYSFTSNTATDRLHSLNVTLSPGLGSRFYYKNFFIHPELRYEAHLKDDLYYTNDAVVKVDGKPADAGWDGMRIVLSLGYRF